MQNKRRSFFRRWGVFSLAATLALALCAIAGGSQNIGADAPLHITFWLALSALSLICCLSLPQNLPPRISATVIILIAIIARVLFLPQIESDDVYRYMFEGKAVANAHNPYKLAPDSPKLAHLHEHIYSPRINHQNLSACYPPLFIYLCAALQAISYSPLIFKILALICDMGILLLLMSLLKSSALPQRLSILYSLCPLVLYAYAGGGHFDPLMTMLIMLAIFFSRREKWACMFISLALAMQIKYVAILGLPFFISRRNCKYLPCFILGLIAMLPALVSYREGVFSSLYTFGAKMAFNGSAHAILRVIFGLHLASLICGGLFISGYATLIYLHWRNKIPTPQISGTIAALTLLLVFSPNMHFWYWGWIIPLAILARCWVLMIPSVTLAFYLVVLWYQNYTGNWHQPTWAYVIQWLPFIAPLIIYVYLLMRRIRNAQPTPLDKFSVIIPVKGNEPELEECIRPLTSCRHISQIIIAASTDSQHTRQIAGKHNAQVVINPLPPQSGGGRGGQISTALTHAINDWIIILHADVILRRKSVNQLARFIKLNPHIGGGALGGTFSPHNARIIEHLNQFRGEFLSISFGDQTQFFCRSTLEKSGGFPAYPLMEDVELSLRLFSSAKSVFLWQDNAISPRKWHDKRLKRGLMIIKLCAKYLLKRIRGEVDTVKMYDEYYRQ